MNTHGHKTENVEAKGVEGVPSMTKTAKSIKVRIFGSEYPLKGENEEFTKNVAQHVDTMLGNIYEKFPGQPPLTIAVLSALNITEELLKEKERFHSSVNFVKGEVEQLTDFLERGIGSTQP